MTLNNITYLYFTVFVNHLKNHLHINMYNVYLTKLSDLNMFKCWQEMSCLTPVLNLLPDCFTCSVFSPGLLHGLYLVCHSLLFNCFLSKLTTTLYSVFFWFKIFSFWFSWIFFVLWKITLCILNNTFAYWLSTHDTTCTFLGK